MHVIEKEKNKIKNNASFKIGQAEAHKENTKHNRKNIKNNKHKKKKCNKKDVKNNKKNSKSNKIILKFLTKTLFLVTTLIFLFSFVFCLYRMSDNYMFPSFRDGDLGVFIRIANFYPQDVILYEQNGKTKAGRIVAIKDQEVEFLKDGGYNINGGPAIDEIPYETYMNEESNVKYPIKLKDNQYFILNDFRENKNDSRTFGVVNEKQIKGKLLFLLRRRSF